MPKRLLKKEILLLNMLNHQVKVLLRKIYTHMHLNLGSTSGVLQLAQIWCIRDAYFVQCIRGNIDIQRSKKVMGYRLNWRYKA